MPRIDFSELPDHGRLWVFPTSRPLTDDETRRSVEVVDDFLAGWAAHGSPLRSGRDVREGRFLVVGVDVDAEAPSGCSIDALVNRLRALGEEMGVTFIDHGPVWYRDGDEVRTATRPQFKGMARGGGGRSRDSGLRHHADHGVGVEGGQAGTARPRELAWTRVLAGGPEPPGADHRRGGAELVGADRRAGGPR